jgi:hypothetical protein
MSASFVTSPLLLTLASPRQGVNANACTSSERSSTRQDMAVNALAQMQNATAHACNAAAQVSALLLKAEDDRETPTPTNITNTTLPKHDNIYYFHDIVIQVIIRILR